MFFFDISRVQLHVPTHEPKPHVFSVGYLRSIGRSSFVANMSTMFGMIILLGHCCLIAHTLVLNLHGLAVLDPAFQFSK